MVAHAGGVRELIETIVESNERIAAEDGVRGVDMPPEYFKDPEMGV
jgi:hypothetical protein